MLAAIFDAVVADAEGSHGCYRLLTERKTGFDAPLAPTRCCAFATADSTSPHRRMSAARRVRFPDLLR
jgi:hypothetical protein